MTEPVRAAFGVVPERPQNLPHGRRRSTAVGSVLVALSGALAGLAGCGAPLRAPPSTAGGEAVAVAAADSATIARSISEGTVALTVANKGFDDVTIWILLAGGGRNRLGNVGGTSIGRFVLDRRFIELQPFRIQAERAGARAGHVSRPITTGPVIVREGQRLLWTLEWDLQRELLEVQSPVPRP